MRKMPNSSQAAINPLDNINYDGSFKPSRKAFVDVNLHYITHNPVYPEFI